MSTYVNLKLYSVVYIFFSIREFLKLELACIIIGIVCPNELGTYPREYFSLFSQDEPKGQSDN